MMILTGRYPSGQREQAVNLLAYAFEGSNPPLPRKHFSELAGIAQLVEHQPSKLRVAGSNPVSRFTDSGIAHVAQQVEHLLGKEEVTGSSPVVGSVIYVECCCKFNEE